jgi:hypothetical protein
LSRYADRIDVLKNPMLRVGTPVVIYDLTDGGQIALNGVDAFEWVSRDPQKYSFTAVPAQQREPKATTAGQVVNLVAASGVQLGGFWLLDITTQTKWVVFSPDYIEWQSRDLRYQPTTPS